MDLFCGNGYNGGKNTAKEIAVGRSEASSIDRLKEGLSQEELLEFFEVAKENYTNFIKTKEPDKYKQKDKIMKNRTKCQCRKNINDKDNKKKR